jgi:hypothetical protein
MKAVPYKLQLLRTASESCADLSSDHELEEDALLSLINASSIIFEPEIK